MRWVLNDSKWHESEHCLDDWLCRSRHRRSVWEELVRTRPRFIFPHAVPKESMNEKFMRANWENTLAACKTGLLTDRHKAAHVLEVMGADVGFEVFQKEETTYRKRRSQIGDCHMGSVSQSVLKREAKGDSGPV